MTPYQHKRGLNVFSDEIYVKLISYFSLAPDTTCIPFLITDWVNIQCLHWHVEVNIIHIIHSREMSDIITFSFYENIGAFSAYCGKGFFF